MHIRRICISTYYTDTLPWGKVSVSIQIRKLLSVSYPYPWELRISAKYLSADTYPRISDSQSIVAACRIPGNVHHAMRNVSEEQTVFFLQFTHLFLYYLFTCLHHCFVAAISKPFRRHWAVFRKWNALLILKRDSEIGTLYWNAVQGHSALGSGSWPLKIYRRSEYVWPTPIKMSHDFIQNCCWITLQVSHNQGWKTRVNNGR